MRSGFVSSFPSLLHKLLNLEMSRFSMLSSISNSLVVGGSFVRLSSRCIVSVGDDLSSSILTNSTHLVSSLLVSSSRHVWDLIHPLSV